MELPAGYGPRFGLDGVCVLHAHTKMRDDIRFWEGFFAYMAGELETYLDRIISRPEKDLDAKIRRLECDFKEAGLYGDDAGLFPAAAHLVRSIRNAFVHSQRNISAEERKRRGSKTDELFLKFGDLASARRQSLLLGMGEYVKGGLRGKIK